MMTKSRAVADVVIGILTAIAPVWVDVTIIHRAIIAVIVAFAAETVLSWIDGKDDKAMQERIRQNRDAIIRNIK